MKNQICKICDQEISDNFHFWKNHKIKEKDYQEKYNPKFDLLTGEKLEFKSRENYDSTDFKSRINLRKYIENKPIEETVDYLSNYLKKRKETKNLIFAPGEFECRTLCFPSITYIEKFYKNNITYKDICNKSDLKCLFDYNVKLSFLNNNNEIICDTRENIFLKFDNFKIKKLNYGDYNIEGSKIFIERKSLIDATGTLSQGFERFEKEIVRCAADESYLIVLIEEKFEHLLSFSYLPHMKKVKATEQFILSRIRQLLRKYPNNLQFLCVDNRAESIRVIKNIFNCQNNIKNIDLQWAYNNKLI